MTDTNDNDEYPGGIERFSPGDRVVLDSIHHAHNPEFKKNEGRGGEVVKTSEGGKHSDPKVYVNFDGMTKKVGNRWWVKPRYIVMEESSQ